MRTRYGALIGLVTLLLLVWTNVAYGQTAVIKVKAMSPHQLEEEGLTTNTSTGFSVVPKGSVVYLEAEEEGGEAISSLQWSVASRPVGSSATFADPTASFAMFTPDTTGRYEIQLSITTATGTDDTTIVVTSAVYSGVGNIGGASPNVAKGQCAFCHAGAVDDKVSEWQETGHAKHFRRGIEGELGSYYSTSCIGCHTTGYDTGPTAVNGGFDDVASKDGWTMPSPVKSGNWDSLTTKYPDLAQLSVIGCESCHGPGSRHLGDTEEIGRSIDVGVCAQCHDEPWRHDIVASWENSKHAEVIESPTRSTSCQPCHTGSGFATKIQGVAVPFEKNITCAACHDPHSAAYEHQLRTVSAGSLTNGSPITLGGLGQLCMNCHKSRRNGETYALAYHDHFGPHGSLQGDMFLGENAVQFGRSIPSSTHKFALADGCVSCHMYATPDTGQVGRDYVGGHTFAMQWDSGTPDDPSDDVENVSACVSCHGSIASFDDIKAAVDYDGNGKVEGVQTEVKGMLKNLAMLLPPIGVDEVVVDTTYTVSQLQTAYNYFFVHDDGSYGVHNLKYAVGLLNYSIGTLTGVEPLGETIPVEYSLEQNYPNPFNPSTEIRFSIPTTGTVRLEIYAITGQKIKTLIDGRYAAGSYKVTWDGTNDAGSHVASGIYMYRIEAKREPSGGFTLARKMVLVK